MFNNTLSFIKNNLKINKYLFYLILIKVHYISELKDQVLTDIYLLLLLNLIPPVKLKERIVSKIFLPS